MAIKVKPNTIKLTNMALSAAAVLALSTGIANAQHNPEDRFEDFNRAMFKAHEAIDGAILKPVSLMYKDLTPKPAQSCIGNIFNNLGDIWSAANSFLQAQGHDFFNTLGRVLFNTTMGLGGCIDVASMNGAERIQNDFGTTLGVWGLGSGPYLFIPVLGPSTFRDSAADLSALVAPTMPIDGIFKIKNIKLRNSTVALYTVNARVNLLEADNLANEVSIDKYSFLRDAYLQRRQAQINYRTNSDAVPDYSLPDYSDD